VVYMPIQLPSSWNSVC